LPESTPAAGRRRRQIWYSNPNVPEMKNAPKIARLSKKSPSRFLEKMQKKITSQNAPQSTISQLGGVMRPPKTTQ